MRHGWDLHSKSIWVFHPHVSADRLSVGSFFRDLGEILWRRGREELKRRIKKDDACLVHHPFFNQLRSSYLVMYVLLFCSTGFCIIRPGKDIICTFLKCGRTVFYNWLRSYRSSFENLFRNIWKITEFYRRHLSRSGIILFVGKWKIKDLIACGTANRGNGKIIRSQLCAIISDDQIVSQISGYTFVSVVCIWKLNGFTGEFQRIDREVFGKSASVDTNTCLLYTSPSPRD